VAGRDVVAVQAILGQRADREVLHHHVGLLRQAADQRLALGMAEVHGNRLLAAVERQVIGRLGAMRPLHARLEAARFVAAAGLLDLDHGGAQLGQDHRGERARQYAREIQYGDAVERSHCPPPAPKLRMMVLASRPTASASASARSATRSKERLVSFMAAGSQPAMRRASSSAASSTWPAGATRLASPSARARAPSMGSASATSSNACLRPN